MPRVRGRRLSDEVVLRTLLLQEMLAGSTPASHRQQKAVGGVHQPIVSIATIPQFHPQPAIGSETIPTVPVPILCCEQQVNAFLSCCRLLVLLPGLIVKRQERGLSMWQAILLQMRERATPALQLQGL